MLPLMKTDRLLSGRRTQPEEAWGCVLKAQLANDHGIQNLRPTFFSLPLETKLRDTPVCLIPEERDGD